jgi:hypothetical protein
MLLLTSMVVVGGLASCTDSGTGEEATPSTLDSDTSSTLAATTTTTTAPVDLDGSLRGFLAEDFAATFRFDSVEIFSFGEARSTGAGAVSGADSEIWRVIDWSDVEGTYLGQHGEVIGSGGVSATSEAFRFVGGVGYSQRDGGPWVISDSAASSTTSIGHVFERLADVSEFDEAAVEIVDGEELAVMTPVDVVSYEPEPFSLPPQPDRFDVTTEVLVDAAGIPRVVRLTIDSAISGYLTSESTQTFRLSDVGSPIVVDHPAVPLMSLTDLDFELFEGGVGLVDLDFPANWEIRGIDTGVVQLLTNRGVLFSIHGFGSPEGSIDEAMLLILDQLAMEPDSIEVSELGVFPSRIATKLGPDEGFRIVYAEKVGPVGIILNWSGPPDSPDLQRADFEELVRSIRWLNGPDAEAVVPGEAYGDAILLRDTREYVLRVATDAGCATPRVVWTSNTPRYAWPVSAEEVEDGWVEEWLVEACDGIDVYTLTFFPSPEGGTDFVAFEPRRLGSTDERDIPDPIQDLSATVLRLRDQPWLVDTDADVDPMVAATAVTEARFRDLHVFVLVLADEPVEDDPAETLLAELGRGTVLVVSPETTWWFTYDDSATLDEVEDAFNGAQGGSNIDLIEQFVASLVDRP